MAYVFQFPLLLYTLWSSFTLFPILRSVGYQGMARFSFTVTIADSSNADNTSVAASVHVQGNAVCLESQFSVRRVASNQAEIVLTSYGYFMDSGGKPQDRKRSAVLVSIGHVENSADIAMFCRVQTKLSRCPCYGLFLTSEETQAQARSLFSSFAYPNDGCMDQL